MKKVLKIKSNLDVIAEKVVEIMKDTHVFHNAYYVVSEIPHGMNDYFEGSTALRDCKEWAKRNGFDKLVLLSNSLKRPDKEYIL